MPNWKPSRRLEIEYAEDLRRVYAKFVELSRSAPLAAAESLLRWARRSATRMVTALYFGGAATWREAARKGGKSRMIYGALQREMQGPVGERVRELVRRNAGLISSLPDKVARRAVASAALRQQQAGGRAGGLLARLQGLSGPRAELIARTEVSKASAALTQARSEWLGLSWYLWRTSQDERVRSSHRKMENVLVNYNDPPSPEALAGIKSKLGHYHAGQAPNDRCYQEAVVRPESLRWPHRVYANGRIQYMTLANFRLLERRAVA
jgi:hypothetical protein